jgi:hypothetical protein
MSNELLEAVTTAVFVLFLSAFIWALRGSRIPLLVVNAITAVVIVVYDINPVRYILEDWRLQAIVAWETLGFVAALFAMRGNRPALRFSYAVGAVHLLIGAFAVYLAFFFRITRLI